MKQAIFHITLAMILFVILVLIFVLNADAKISPTPTIEFKPLPVEEQFKHDADIKFEEWQEENEYLIEITDEEVALVARVIMSEASVLDRDAKLMVGATIVNRVRSGRFGNTVTEVVNYPNAYSTQDNGDPTSECYEVAEEVLKNEIFPLDLYYFRANKPHSFGYEYAHIGNTYFSTETNYGRSEND